MENTYSVYCHRNLVNGKVYVGKAKNIAKRWGHNGNGYVTNKDTIFANAIRKYGWSAFDHIIIADCLTNETACALESYLIDLWRTNISKYGSTYGYNMTDGGEGTAGISSGCKSVFCIETGELYPSVTESATLHNISVTALTAVCRGRRSFIRGLHWRYATEEDIENYRTNGNPVRSDAERQAIIDCAYNRAHEIIRIGRYVNSNKPVLCLEPNILLPSISAAALFAKVDMREVSKSVNDHKRGVSTPAGGYHWRFVNDAEIRNHTIQQTGGCVMQGKFIYVFDTDARDKLLSANYQLLKADEQQNIFVFENKETHTFAASDAEDFTFVLSDTLTF